MTTALMENMIYWMNAFPHSNGVSSDLSPGAIVLGCPHMDYNHSKITFGTFAMVYTWTTNRMTKQSVEAIALNPSNEKGGYYFMSLETGKRIHGYIWEELPIDKQIIDRVESIAKKEKQPELLDGCLLFEWAPGITIDESDEEQVNNIDNIEDEQLHEMDEENNIKDNLENNHNNDIAMITDDESADNSFNDIDQDKVDMDEGAEDNGILDDISEQQETDNNNSFNEDDNDKNIQANNEDVNEDNSSKVQSDTDVEDNEPSINNKDDEVHRSSRSTAGQALEHLEMSFKGKEYGSKCLKKQSLQFLMKKHLDKLDGCMGLECEVV
jgi:hypothetical protein